MNQEKLIYFKGYSREDTYLLEEAEKAVNGMGRSARKISLIRQTEPLWNRTGISSSGSRTVREN